MKRYLVFTDLDGSLLNHDDYDFTAALPAIQQLNDRSIPIIFTSSKTLDELRHIGELTGIQQPVIHETGCGITWPDGYFTHQPGNQHSLCAPYEAITRLLAGLRNQHQYRFNGFHDLSIDEIAAITGLSHAQAKLARSRQYGEPVQWQDTDERLDTFRQQVEAAGFHLIQGGRFIHVMSPVNKASAIQWLVAQYRQSEPGTEWLTIGLGDSMNDQQLLEAVDFPYLVRNLHLTTQQAQLTHLPKIKLTKQCGAAGWNEAISGFLETIYE